MPRANKYQRNPFWKGEFNEEAYVNGRESAHTGHVADYITELAKANAEDFGICVRNVAGEIIAFGETEKRFSIQSISKVINLAAALKFLGFRETFSHVKMEPSGDPFNSIMKLDTASDLPFNPMTNAGAIQAMSMLSNLMDFDELLDFARAFCMDADIVLNEEIYRSEAETGDRNRAIAYLLKSKGVLQGDPEKTLDLYFRMCSLNVNARPLPEDYFVFPEARVAPGAPAVTYRAKLPQREFMLHAKAMDSSPAAVTSLLLARAMAEVHPENTKPVIVNTLADYTGALKWGGLDRYCDEYVTQFDIGPMGVVIEMYAVGDSFVLSFMTNLDTDAYYRAFLRQLE